MTFALALAALCLAGIVWFARWMLGSAWLS